MIVQIKERRSNKILRAETTAHYFMPWSKPNNPAALVTFETYLPEVKGLDPYEDLRMDNFTLTGAGGWLCGWRPHLPAPSKLFRHWDDFAERAFGERAKGWKHSGRAVQYPSVVEIPAGLPGAGMIVVENLSVLNQAPLRGDHVERQQKLKEQAEMYLQILGFHFRPDPADS